jgi:hypothetical protein
MIPTMERVIWPGWLTLLYEDESTESWFCYHRCVNCGAVVDGASLQPGRDEIREHTAKNHSAEMFNFDMYLFLSAIHALDAYHGLIAFQWPDTASCSPRAVEPQREEE